MEELHRESLEEEATHATGEARMLLPGIQALLGFQLIAVFNTRFVEFSAFEQRLHLSAIMMTALAMALMMTPAAYHRKVGRGVISRRFVRLASRMLTLSLVPFAVGIGVDFYLLASLILHDHTMSLAAGLGVTLVLAALWYALPHLIGRGIGE